MCCISRILLYQFVHVFPRPCSFFSLLDTNPIVCHPHFSVFGSVYTDFFNSFFVLPIHGGERERGRVVCALWAVVSVCDFYLFAAIQESNCKSVSVHLLVCGRFGACSIPFQIFIRSTSCCARLAEGFRYLFLRQHFSFNIYPFT